MSLPSFVERQLLESTLSGQHKSKLLDALLEWKSGTSLQRALVERGLISPGIAGMLQSTEGEVGAEGGTLQGGSAVPRAGGEVAPPKSTRYHKVRLHARGGLGEVFVARDEELQREVALKEIQSHAADDLESRSRFVREAEVTGNLEHPGIVPVYGLGTYHDGRPYYAMRFIHGESMDRAITTYHALPEGGEKPLALRRLLGRFVAVCHAVGFAHSKGIIHRDLKPANVMLGEYGETLVVDWGLARRKEEGRRMKDEGRKEQSDPAESSFIPRSSPFQGGTQLGQIMGTPAYMSPEQAAGQNDLVGAASDIYSLGVILYQLLAGRVPIEHRGDLYEVLEKINRGDYPPPGRVKPGTARPLEAICLKAMALTIEDRYTTAQDLAAEVERWLADEPVMAYREPMWDRLRRWSRRHRTLMTSGVMVLLVSVVALIVGITAVGTEQARTAYQRDQAIEARQEANDNMRRARDAEKKATDNLKEARENLKLAKKAVTETFDVAKNHRLLQQSGMQEVRKLLLEKALPFYQKFRTRHDNDPKARAELADQWFRVGYITTEIGDPQEGQRAYRQAEKVARALIEDYPKRPGYQAFLATLLMNLGHLFQTEGKRGEALQVTIQAKEIFQNLARTNPSDSVHRADLARTLNNLGNLLRAERRRGEALKAYTQARDIQQKLVKDNPNVTKYQNTLAGILTSLGNLLHVEGKRGEALKAYTEAREIHEKLAKENPPVSQYQYDRALTLINMGNVLKAEMSRSAALKVYQEAREILEELSSANPAVAEYQKHLADLLTSMGHLQEMEGNPGEALKIYLAARRIHEKLAKAHPTVKRYQHLLAGTLTNIGVLLDEGGKRGEALKAYTAAREIREKLVKTDPTVTVYQYELAILHHNIGVLMKEEGNHSEALKAYGAATTIKEKLVKANPSVRVYQSSLAETLNNRALLHRARKAPKEALGDLNEAMRYLRAVLKREPRNTQAGKLLLRVLYNRAFVLTDLGRHAEAADDWGDFSVLAPSSYRTASQLRRAHSLALAGSVDQAMQEAERVGNLAKLPGLFHYQLACIASRCASWHDLSQPLPRREQVAEARARKAIAWLRQAQKAGLFKTKANRDQLYKDPDLAVLRDRNDFKQWAKTLPGD